MTSVCSVGLDMIAIPGDTPRRDDRRHHRRRDGHRRDQRQDHGLRLIPVPGAKAGDRVDFGGLFGRAPVMAVRDRASVGVVERAGHVPAAAASAGELTRGLIDGRARRDVPRGTGRPSQSERTSRS